MSTDDVSQCKEKVFARDKRHECCLHAGWNLTVGVVLMVAEKVGERQLAVAALLFAAVGWYESLRT